MRLTLRKDRFGVRAIRLALLALCCLLGLAVGGEAAGHPASNTHTSSSSLNANFAIADFDGDRKPDLATVEVQRTDSSANTRYSIRFKLTAGITQVFGLTAPAGGLQIVARDVNGDDALDLLISTAWQHEQVAVLLNDGHGNFTLADPRAFPGSLWGSESQWKSGAVEQCESAALVRCLYSAGDFTEKTRLDGQQQQASCENACFFGGSARLLIFSLLGRAPPSFIH